MLRPRVSLVFWAADLAAWHVPAVYDYALTHQAAHDLEHLSFLVGGLLVWTQLLDPARQETLRLSERLGFALAMFAFALALAGTLVLARPLYPAYVAQAGRLFGTTPALDQQLAALVMLVEQAASLTLCAGLLRPLGARVRSSLDRGGTRHETGPDPFGTGAGASRRAPAPAAVHSDAVGIR